MDFIVSVVIGKNILTETINGKKKKLGRIGEERFRREYDCEFLVL